MQAATGMGIPDIIEAYQASIEDSDGTAPNVNVKNPNEINSPIVKAIENQTKAITKQNDVIRQTLPFMPPTLRAMVQLQRILGMRPNEIFKMRVGDIDTTRGNGLWYFVPGSYKTAQFVGKIVFPLGKPEQKLIAPYLADKALEAAVFSPRVAMRERNAERRANRKTKIPPSQAARSAERATKPSRYSEFYNRDSYHRAIGHAIKRGNRQLPDGEKIPHWSPYQLRHAAATDAELANSDEDAQALLGHLAK